jgi:nucleotide-binding universal stress UspA family protein
MTTSRTRIVVGCDGSPDSERALAWAANYAHATNGALTLVAAWDWPTFQDAPIVYGDYDPRTAAKDLVEGMRAHSAIDAATVVARGSAAQVLMDAAADSDLLVVGSHGRGVVERIVLGSVSLKCAMQARVPVVIVRDGVLQARRGVLVGIDDSEGARRALRWAMNYADAVHEPMDVVHAVDMPTLHTTPAYPMLITDLRPAVHHRAEQWAREFVDKQEAERGRAVESALLVRVLDGSAGRLLVEQSELAAVTVIGRRGGGGFRRLVLGSVSSAVAHHASSTTVVVPE